MFPNPISWGFDRLTGWATGAAGDIANNVFSALTGWVLEGAFRMMTLVSALVFSNESLAAGCTTGTLEGCSRTSFIFGTFSRSRNVAAVLLVVFTVWSIGRAAISGDPGTIARKFFFEVPKAVLLAVLILQLTILMLLVTDEISTFLTHPALGPDRDEFFARFAEVHEDSAGGALAGFTILLLSVAMTIGAIGVWVLMMLRSAGIAILVTLAPLIAVLSVTSYSQSMQKLMKLMWALVASKLIIVLCMSLGVSAVMNMPWVRAGLDSETVVVQPPAAPGDDIPDPIEVGDLEGAQEATAVAYQLASGALILFAAMFSPMLVMQLIPDSVEQYYAFGHGSRAMSRTNQTMLGAAKSPAAAVRRRSPGAAVSAGGGGGSSGASQAGSRSSGISTSGARSWTGGRAWSGASGK